MTQMGEEMLEQMDVEMLQQEYKKMLQEEYEEHKLKEQREKLVAKQVVLAETLRQLKNDGTRLTQGEEGMMEQIDVEMLQQNYRNSPQRKRHIDEQNTINRHTKTIRRRIRRPKTL